MTVKTVYAADISKTYRDDNGVLIVEGIATSADLDLDRQVCDPEWLKSAMPEWFEWGNIRAQHSDLPAGHAVDMQELPGDKWWIKAAITEPTAADMAEKTTYKGFSIGIKDPVVYRDQVAKSLGATGGRIAGGTIVHVGMVDRPCNPIAKLSLAKAAAPGMTVKAADLDRDRMLLKVFEVEEHPENAELPGDPDEVRKAAEPETPAEPHPAEAVVEAVKALGVDLTITKASPDEDIASAQEAIAIIGRIIVSEAQSLAAGQLSDTCDIDELLCAVRALKWFMCLEADEEAEAPAEMVTIPLAAEPDTTKSSEPDPAPAAGSENLTELVEAAVRKATEASEERYKALEAQMAKVLATPVPGGPAITRQTGDEVRAAEITKAAEAERFQKLADTVTDREMAAYYRNKAAQLTGAPASEGATA